MGIFGILLWVLSGVIWSMSKSAIHEILAAIIALNGTILLSASKIITAIRRKEFNFPSTNEKSAETKVDDKIEWRCKCGEINFIDVEKCPKCGRSSKAVV